jgi:hypothetical protein
MIVVHGMHGVKIIQFSEARGTTVFLAGLEKYSDFHILCCPINASPFGGRLGFKLPL